MYNGKYLKQLMLDSNKSLTRSAQILGVPSETLNESFKLPVIEDAAMLSFCDKLGLVIPPQYRIMNDLFYMVEYLSGIKNLCTAFVKILKTIPNESLRSQINTYNELAKKDQMKKIVDDLKSHLAELGLELPARFEEKILSK